MPEQKLAPCDCPFEGDTPASESRCSASTSTEDRSRWLCTRPEGHDGPHSACLPNEHPVHTWEGEA